MDIPYQERLIEVDSVIQTLYDETFGDLFAEVSKLYERYKSHTQPITDAELEKILIELPLHLFTVSERLSSMKLHLSVTKLETKRMRRVNAQKYHANGIFKNDADVMIEDDSFNDEVAVLIYNAVIERVERQLTFSRELIMGAKKLWDSRKSNTLPIGEVGDKAVPPLPEYIDWTHKDTTTNTAWGGSGT